MIGMKKVHVEAEGRSERKHRVDHHLRKECLLPRDELGGERRAGRLLEHLPPCPLRLVIKLDRDRVQASEAETASLPECLDDDLRMNALLNVRLALAQELAGEEND